MFIITLSLFAIIYLEIPSQSSINASQLPIQEFTDFYPFDLHTSSITSNQTHYILFGGSNDSWFGRSQVITVNKAKLANLKPTDNPQDLYTVIGNLPNASYNMGLIKDGNFVYLFGGVDAGNHSSSILKVNLSSYPLTFYKIANLPFGMEKPIVSRLGQIVYIFGGLNSDMGINQSEIYEFNLTDYSITSLNVFVPNLNPKIAYFNNKFYLIGGFSLDTNVYSSSIYSFDPRSNTIQKVGNLPSAVDVETSVQYDNKLLILTETNSTFFSDQPAVLDLNTLKVSKYSVPMLTGSNLIQSPQILYSGESTLFLMGGWVPYKLTLRHNIYRIDLTALFGKTIINSNNDAFPFETQNNESTFIRSNVSTTFSFNDNHSLFRYPFTKIKLKAEDTLSLKVSYFSHVDPNSRQRILIGYTSDTPITNVDIFNTVPSSNFIGLQLQNSIINSKTYILINVIVVMNKQSLLLRQFSYKPDQLCDISFSLTLLNETSYYYTLNINGNSFNEIRNSSLTNMPLNYFATWNQNTNTNYALEGNYNGSINYFSLYSSVQSPSTQPIKNLVFLGILFNILIILMLAYISLSPKYKYLATGEKPNGVPTALVSLGFYNLYLMLKKAFEKISEFSIVSLEDEAGNFGSAFQGNFDFIKDNQSIIFDQNNFKDITGMDIKILIVLLDYLDHGTYLKQVMVKSGIKKSTFYATINKLKSQELVDYVPASNDQRKKFIVLSPKGFYLLRVIYFHLDTYFNGKST